MKLFGERGYPRHQRGVLKRHMNRWKVFLDMLKMIITLYEIKCPYTTVTLNFSYYIVIRNEGIGFVVRK